MTYLRPVVSQPVTPRPAGVLHGTTVVTLVVGCLAGTGGYRDGLLNQLGTGSPAHATHGLRASTEQGLSLELKVIRKSLRLSVLETAHLFGVSRPTIYSWQRGNPILPENAERLRSIAQALEPHLPLLEAQVGRIAQRAIEGRTTLLQKLAQGADAHEALGSLAEILRREDAQRERLARRLQGRTGSRGAPDLDTLG